MLILNKAIAVIMMGFLSSVIFGLILIPILKRLKCGQRISAFVGENHRKKEGTPTMGGLIFIIPTVIITLLLIAFGYLKLTSDLGIVLFVFIAYALLGFLDDFLSIKRKSNEGLTTPEKFLGQLVIAIIVFYLYMRGGGETSLVVSTLGINIEMGWFYGVFLLFLLIGSSNAVNITDGLDGLAGGLSAIAFIAFSLITMFVGYTDLGLFTFLLVGCLFGFLVYNTHPAKVFMGDTGSLSLGGVMAVVAILVHREVTLFVVALVFVIETVSVILQTFWIIVFHKKLFLMTPLHHHFEKLGWCETDIVKLFWVVGLVLAMGGIYFGIWL
ncbi:MAG: phospho-N-acetylmuramoyl-pentapeptide-transferase [Bacilli bacterium]